MVLCQWERETWKFGFIKWGIYQGSFFIVKSCEGLVSIIVRRIIPFNFLQIWEKQFYIEITVVQKFFSTHTHKAAQNALQKAVSFTLSTLEQTKLGKKFTMQGKYGDKNYCAQC